VEVLVFIIAFFSFQIIKKAPRNRILETSKNNTRGTTQITVKDRPFRLQQALSLNAGKRKMPTGKFQLFGSEGMGT